MMPWDFKMELVNNIVMQIMLICKRKNCAENKYCYIITCKILIHRSLVNQIVTNFRKKGSK